MDFILPTTITNAMIIGSNVAENEHNEWATGGFSQISTNAYNFTKIAWASSGNLYARLFGTGSIYKSTDGGVTWGVVGGASTGNTGVFANGTNIYTWNSNTIYCDTGESGTFTDLSEAAKPYVSMCKSVAGHVYAFDTSGEVYKQPDGAGAFSKVYTSSIVWKSSCGASDGSIYAVDASGNMYRSDNECATFSDLGLTDYVFEQICADNNLNIYGIVNAGDLYKRTAGAGQFLPIGDTTRAWKCCCYDTTNNYLFAGTSNSYVFRATGTTVYALNDYVQITSGLPKNHGIYQSAVNSNANNNPQVTDVNGNISTNTTYWTYIGNTNRSKSFDETIGAQSSQATPVKYVLAPGAVDSLGMMNIESSTLTVVEADHSTDKITNGAFAGASGTTQSTGWDKVGTPTAFVLSSGWLGITSDANGEGQSQTFAVSAATKYMFNLLYTGATADDDCQLIIRDMTNGADILAATDLPNGTDFTNGTIYNYVFTTPAGCISIKISLLCKTSGDTCWFKTPSFSDVVYDSGTVTIGATKTEYVNTSLIQKSDCLIAITVNHATTAKVGELIVGVQTDCGTTEKAISGGTKSYSTKTVDTFGHYTVTPRGYSKKLTCTTHLAKTSFDALGILINLYRDVPLVWIASTTYNATQIYGYYIDHQWSILDEIVVINWELEGLS